MKYIKTFENIKFDKYVIFESIENLLILAELSEVNNKDIIRVAPKYGYNCVSDKVEELTNQLPYVKFKRIMKGKILFSSNDFQECLNVLPLIKSSNKYNL